MGDRGGGSSKERAVEMRRRWLRFDDSDVCHFAFWRKLETEPMARLPFVIANRKEGKGPARRHQSHEASSSPRLFIYQVNIDGDVFH